MIKKRLIGVITVLDGWAVQSIGYQKYLPLGKPTCLAQNLDNWGVDEILIQSINRSVKKLGPDFDLLKSLSELSLSTPLIYSGGINSISDAVNSIKFGSERIAVDFLLQQNPNLVKDIVLKIGYQALIASVPLSILKKNIYWFDYQKKTISKSFDILQNLARENLISEFFLIDKDNEGKFNSFDNDIYKLFPIREKPLILFGGISEKEQIKKLLNEKNISSIAIGNFLNYKEHMVQNYRNEINHPEIRNAFYNQEIN